VVRIEYTIEKEDVSLLFGIELLNRQGVFLAATRITDLAKIGADAVKQGDHGTELSIIRRFSRKEHTSCDWTLVCTIAAGFVRKTSVR